MRYLILFLLLTAPIHAQSQQPPPAEKSAATKEAPAGQAGATTAVPEEQRTGPEYELVDLLGGKDQLARIQQQFVDAMVATNPALEPYKSTVNEWARRYISWDEMREVMARVYRDYFKAGEIDEMLVFYRTATGRKSILLMPALLREGNQAGKKMAQDHRADLVEMLREAQDK